jgi:hypothetical protein
VQGFENVGQVSQSFLSDVDSAKVYYNTASATIPQMFAGASMSPSHANLPSNPGPRNVQKELDKMFEIQQRSREVT